MNVNMLTSRTSLSEGGIQNTGFLLASTFNKQEKISVHLITDESSDIPDNVNATKVVSDGKPNVLFYLRMRKALKAEKKSNINLCLYWKCGIPCFIYKIFRLSPYAVMVYGNELMSAQKITVKRFIYECLRKLILDHASCIFACSEYTKRLCARMCKNKNIAVIHPPVRFEEAAVSVLPRTYTVFSIGRHVERKGFQDVIRAMPELRRMYPRIRYRLAGDGPFHSELVELTRELGLEDCVEFLGKISEEQKRKELQNCDLFIMTSHTDEEHCEVEGFGICYLEANAYGKWVIARDSGGVSDAVIDGVTGRLLPNSEPEAICRAVDEFYTSLRPDPQKMREWAQAHSPETIAQQYIEKLKEYEK